MFKHTIKALLLVFISLYLSGCGEMGFNNWRWHQKMTVEVEVNGKIITGSAVTSIHWWPNFFSGGWGGPSWLSKVRGEAVTVDLGEGKYLFALLRYARNTEYIQNLATRSLQNSTKSDLREKKGLRGVVSLKEPIIVPRKAYPLLVTFENIKDPSTVKQVDPDNLSATFGKGHQLKVITLEITDEPVTKGRIETVLGWLGLYPGTKLGAATNRTDNIPFYRRVSHGSFLRR